MWPLCDATVSLLEHLFCYSRNVPESIPATLHHSHPNKTTVNSRKFQRASQSETWKASSACSSLRHLACAKNSHFLAISTETGYLFLLTALALNIKSQVPPHVSCPDHNPRHRAIPLAPQALNEGKASAHKQTPNIPLSLSVFLPLFLSGSGCEQAKLHLNYCIFFFHFSERLF